MTSSESSVGGAKVIVVTAADSLYFRRLQGLVLSIREKHELEGVSLGVLDVGMVAGEIGWLRERGCGVLQPGWDVDFPGRDSQPESFKASFGRPFLPRYFPQFDVYAWFDADTWIQRPEVLGHFVSGARDEKLAICPEIDVGYRSLYRGGFRNQDWRWHYKKLFGRSEREKWIGRPMLNCGVFALSAGSRHWEAWQETLAEAVSRRVFFCAEQLSLHHAVYSRGLPISALPSTCNWLSHDSLPHWDVEKDLLTTPYPPYEPIGVMHMTASTENEPDRVFTTTSGGTRRRSRKYRDGRY